MSDINKLEDITRNAKKTFPNVFIKRLVIYENISPISVIREVSFSLGVNIVLTLQDLSSEGSVDITGHSVGKTTLCRFIRHILGEPSYSNEISSKLISQKFPNAWIGAEISIHQKEYSVLRHIGNRSLQSRIADNISLEELIEISNDSPSKFNVPQESYLMRLGLEEPYSFENPRCSEDTNWLQVLSWCSRDQEARYKNLYTWRDTDSGSKTPVFSSSKEGPLYVIRYLLNLINSNEINLEKECLNNTKEISAMDERLEHLKITQNLQLDYIKYDLQKNISKIDPFYNVEDRKIINEPGLIPIESSIENDCSNDGPLHKTYQNRINDINRQLYKIVEEFDALLSNRQQLENRKNQLELILNIDTNKEELSKTTVEKYVKQYEEEKDNECFLGRCKKMDCYHIIGVLEKLKPELDSCKKNNKGVCRQIENRKLEIQKDYEEISKNLIDVKLQLEELKNEENNLISSRALLESIWVRIRELIENYKESSSKLINPQSNTELIFLKERRTFLEENLKNNKKVLKGLILSHEENKKTLARVYDIVVKNVLKGSYCKGDVSFQDRNITFAIKRKDYLFGQAMEVLSVILADISALLYSTINQTKHPLFLIHDSPKEADLDDRIYKSFISFIVNFSNTFPTPPFQYIITTTTPPHEDIFKTSVIRAKLSTDETLLKVNIFSEENLLF